MRVLLVTHYFPPEIGAPQARLADMARYWAHEGVDVTVLTGMPNHPTGVLHSGYRRAVVRREHRDGYEVIRTWLYATRNRGLVKRTLNHISFAISGVLLGGWRTGPCDVVVVSSPTFFSIGTAWLIARLRRARLVVEVRDLWPAIFVELGVLRNRRLIRLLELWELATYHAADAVVVVSEGFRDNLIKRGVPPAKIVTIRNGVDVAGFRGPHPEVDPIRARLGARPGETLILYLGAHGISHALPKIVETAALLTDAPVHFSFVGDGEEKEKLADAVREFALEEKVSLVPSVSHEAVPGILNAADICLVPLRDIPLFSTFIPSKMFEYLAAGRAVVGSVRGEARQILREAGAVVVDPEDSAGLAGALRVLAHDRALRCDMGKRGRDYVAEHFDRRDLATTYRKLLESLVNNR